MTQHRSNAQGAHVWTEEGQSLHDELQRRLIAIARGEVSEPNAATSLDAIKFILQSRFGWSGGEHGAAIVGAVRGLSVAIEDGLDRN